MRVGILGTGFGAFHAKMYKGHPDVQDITIFGRNKEKLDSISKDLSITATNSINDIIGNKEIDLVDVCLPSSMHRQYVIDALKAGQNVFVETPVCLIVEDAYAMLEAEKKYGKTVYVNQFIKNEYPYEYLYETVRSSVLGKLKALHIRRKTPPLWGDLSLSKIVRNLMIHEFDFVTWLLGSPHKVTSSGVNGHEGQSHVDALLSFENCFVEVQGSSMMPMGHPFTVGYEAVFEKGTIEYFEHGYECSCERSLVVFANGEKKELEIMSKDCYEESVKHVIECCIKNTPNRLSLKAAVTSLEAALKVDEQVNKSLSEALH
jgi:UDP-N-acetylglucosamine 3-dehydrogenase